MNETTLAKTFTELCKVNVSKHVEKKGGFSYLSWPYAVQVLRESDPSATWSVVRHNGNPYIKTECGFFVEVAVTCNGIELSQIHPVLDNRNQPIASPTSYHINTSIQRCLVKAIALHGLGLYIYAGEDLPDDSSEQRQAPTAVPQVKPLENDKTDALLRIELAKLFQPIADDANKYFTSFVDKDGKERCWILPSETIADLPIAKVKIILANKDAFLKAIQKAMDDVKM